MNKSLLIGAVSTIALTACASMGPDGGMGGGKFTGTAPLDQFCLTTQVVHCVDVKVSFGAIVAISDVGVSTPNHIILWRIDPLLAPYSFPDDGIVFKTALPAHEFNCRSVAGGKLFLCIDRNSTPGTYSYTVKVTRDLGGAPITLDPKIVNN